jgi:hypothetical protein
MWKFVAISVVTLVVAAVSSANAGADVHQARAAAARTVGTPAFVGRWSRVTTCQEIVAMLKKAGLGAAAPAMLAGNGLVSGTPQQLAKKPNICAGARPRVHYHYFTKDGRFGSLDWHEEPVDDGRYRVVDAGTFRIGQALFRYRVSGSQLALTPVITAAAKRQALAKPLDFSTAGWQIAVAFPGHTWKRVPCKGWC